MKKSTKKAIDTEMERQLLKHGENSIGSEWPSYDTKMVILMREVGEVCEELPVNHGETFDRNAVIKELTQVAACAISWLESLQCLSD